MSADRPSRIILTTDFSAGAARAYPLAVDVARRHRAELIVLHVMTVYAELADVYGLRSYPDNVEKAARKQLADLQLDDTGDVSVRREVVGAPTPAAGVVAFAAQESADLIVMSTHGRRVLAQIILGSVTDRVIGSSHCPVLCTRQKDSLKLDEHDHGLQVSRILVPTDPTDPSVELTSCAVEWARQYGAEIHLLCIVPFEIPTVYFASPVISVFDLDTRAHERIRDRLEELKQAVPDDIPVTIAVEEGAPAKRIARYVERQRIDMVIMGRRGVESGPHLLGSVTERLLHDVHRPILVL
jgi:nucleotide-binding universal stress UspA family protein